MRVIFPLNLAILHNQIGEEELIDMKVKQQPSLELPKQVVMFHWSSEKLVHFDLQYLCRSSPLVFQRKHHALITESLDGCLKLSEIGGVWLA